MKRSMLIGFLCMILIVRCGSSEESVWKNAEKIGTRENYEKYLSDYPEGKYISEAKEKIMDIDFALATQENTVEAFKKFLSAYPDSKYSQDAQDRLIFAAYKEAIKENTADGYNKFINQYPQTSLSENLKKKVKHLNPSPNINFSPEQFFSFRLKHPNSTDMPTWLEAYKMYYYNEGKKESYNPTEEYALYTTIDPESKYIKKIYREVFNREPSYGFEDEVNFILFEEYKRRFPNGEYIKEIDDDKVLSNEIGYLEKIYLSEPIKRIITAIQNKEISSEYLTRINQLYEEVNAFECLDINNENQCTEFLALYPACPYSYLIRENYFDLYKLAYHWHKKSDEFISPMVKWITYEESQNFYHDMWGLLNQKIQGKTPEQQLDVLEPWLTTANYRFVSMEEKVFLTDILSWATILHLNENKGYRAALSNFTGSAVLHTVFNDIQGKLLSNLFETLDFSNIYSWQNMQQQMLYNAETCKTNIRNGRDLLYNLGIVSYTVGSLDIFNELAKLQSEDDKQKKEAEKSAKENKKDILASDDQYQNTYIQILLNLFKEDSDCWPSLRAFTYFPDKRALEPVILMPRFYDYESDIEEFIDKFKDESIQLAKEWLNDQNASSFKKARALYVLGYHKKKLSNKISRSDLGDYGYFYDYYHLCINSSPRDKYLNSLIETASKRDKIALVLYNRVRGDNQTPSELKNWLIEQIEEKKYEDNQALHIYQGIIAGLSPEDKELIVDKMYNSYNQDWKDIASACYTDIIPSKVSEGYVSEVIHGSVPWKKTDLINYLANKEIKTYNQLISEYLSGKAYTDGDSKLIYRNLVNMFTKDVVLGYNERINWSAVNSAVYQAESKYKAILISSASDGLDLLEYEQAVEVIKKRFLTDDLLCIQGARWIVQNFDSTKTKSLNFLNVNAKTKLQAAALSFLKARFSDNQNYDDYVNKTLKLKEDDNWPQLISLGVQYMKDETFKEDEATTVSNPVNDFSLMILINNIKTRYLTILTQVKKS